MRYVKSNFDGVLLIIARKSNFRFIPKIKYIEKIFTVYNYKLIVNLNLKKLY